MARGKERRSDPVIRGIGPGQHDQAAGPRCGLPRRFDVFGQAADAARSEAPVELADAKSDIRAALERGAALTGRGAPTLSRQVLAKPGHTGSPV